MGDPTRRLGSIYRDPIYIHSHVRTFEYNILQDSTFTKSLDTLYEKMRERYKLITKVFDNEVKMYKDNGIDLLSILTGYDLFKEEVKKFSDLKTSFSKIRIEDVDFGEIQFDPKMNIEQFFKANGVSFNLDLMYDDEFTVREAVTRRLAHVMKISTSPSGKITNIKQRKKGESFDLSKSAQLDRELSTITLAELGFSDERNTIRNNKNAKALLKVLKPYTEAHISKIDKVIEDKKKEFIRLLQTSVDGLARLDPHVGNAQKNINIINGIGEDGEKIESLDSIMKRTLFTGKKFKGTLLKLYSKLGYLWEIISLDAFRKAIIKTLGLKADNFGIELTTQSDQLRNTSDIILKDILTAANVALEGKTPFGISIKSNLKGMLYGNRDYGSDDKATVHTGLLGDLNPSKILYFFINYNTLSEFNVERYKREESEEQINTTRIESTQLFDIKGKIEHLLKANTLIMGVLGSVFASIDKEEDLYDIQKVTSLPIILSFPNTSIYTADLLKKIEEMAFSSYGTSFSLRNKNLEANGSSIWKEKRKIIEGMLATNNHLGYSYIKSELGDVLDIYDKNIPLVVYYNLNIPKILGGN